MPKMGTVPFGPTPPPFLLPFRIYRKEGCIYAFWKGGTGSRKTLHQHKYTISLFVYFLLFSSEKYYSVPYKDL
jgi:hypothetical protein